MLDSLHFPGWHKPRDLLCQQAETATNFENGTRVAEGQKINERLVGDPVEQRKPLLFGFVRAMNVCGVSHGAG